MIDPFALFVCAAICFVMTAIALFLDARTQAKREIAALKELESPFVKHFGISEDV